MQTVQRLARLEYLQRILITSSAHISHMFAEGHLLLVPRGNATLSPTQHIHYILLMCVQNILNYWYIGLLSPTHPYDILQISEGAE